MKIVVHARQTYVLRGKALSLSFEIHGWIADVRMSSGAWGIALEIINSINVLWRITVAAHSVLKAAMRR